VLGTSFNVNTYKDEQAITTTLLEGSIRITEGKQNVILKPGEQSAGFRIAGANLQQTIAWKDHMFYFEGTDLKTIMRQISRWYDVNVVFASDAPSYDFNAKLPDSLPVSEVLKLLELTNLVHFEIEGNTITVKK
jgi:ferric-dicitrate binding protein FerR (iron transport regulator)